MKKLRRLNLIWLISLWVVGGFVLHMFEYVGEVNDGVKDYWRGKI